MKTTTDLKNKYRDFISENYTTDKDAPSFKEWKEGNVTKVKFVKIKAGDFKGEVTAVFPEELYNENLYGKSMVTCYAHIGQHSGCDIEWVKSDNVPAKENEYADLKAELESIGYNLQVLNSN